MDLRLAKERYLSQKRQAGRRGIGWELTFKQWLDWWGEDLENRGSRVWNLQMQRVADSGPYALGNIRKGDPKQNRLTRSIVTKNRLVEVNKRAFQIVLDAAEAVNDRQMESEDESISDYMSRDRDDCVIRRCKWDTIHG